MSRSRAVLLDGTANPVVLADYELDGGKEARVFEVPTAPDIVVKVYFKPSDAVTHRLERMLAFAGHDEWLTDDEQAHPELAWPIALARDPQTTGVVGYSMRLVGEPEFHPLGTLFSHRERVRYFPQVTWRFPLGIARNLSALIARLHHRGLIIGDLSDRNLVVSQKGYLTVLDCDSIEFTDPVTGERFAGELATADYAAPELHFNEFAARTPQTDDFALAVMIYRLLMLGDHPYMGTPLGRGDEQNLIGDNIRNGISYVVAPDGVQLRASALAVDVLPADLRALAERAFGEGHLNPSSRPEAAEWAMALQRAQQELVTCDVQPRHVYGGHLTQCPWCARMTAGRPDLFPVPTVPAPKPPAAAATPDPLRPVPTPMSRPAPRRRIPRTAVVIVLLLLLIVIIVLIANAGGGDSYTY